MGLDLGSMRELKAQHLKERGDKTLKQENFKDAWTKYTEALQLSQSKDACAKLLSNRSLAYAKALRFADALSDAEQAAAAQPTWDKAFWRKGQALMGLKRHPQAVMAFLQSWRLSKGGRETERMLWTAVQRLTREELGAGLLSMLCQQEEEGVLEPATIETITQQEMVEAWFKQLHAEHQGQSRPGPYFHRYLSWLKGQMSSAEAYCERAAMYCQAKCYLQARSDAQHAVEDLQQRLKEANADQNASLAATQQLAQAYLRLGRAYCAEHQHEDQDYRAAVKAFTKGQDLDPDNHQLAEALQETGHHLTSSQLHQVVEEVYNEAAAAGGVRRPPLALGITELPAEGERIFKVDARLTLPQASTRDLSAKARQDLRTAIASHAQLPMLKVLIEGVQKTQTSNTSGKSGVSHVSTRLAGTQISNAMQPSVASSSSMPSMEGISTEAPESSGRHSDNAPGKTTSPESPMSVLESVIEHPEASPIASTSKATGYAAVGTSGPNGAACTADMGHSPGSDSPAAADVAQPHAASCAASSSGVRVALAVHVGTDEAKGHWLVQQLQEELSAVIGATASGEHLATWTGAMCCAEVIDITPKAPKPPNVEAHTAAAKSPPPNALVQAARPKRELALPFQHYRLVRVDGSAPERTDKHPFCMSRVYYSANEKPEEVWAEMADGSCRWRQTGSEIKVMALKVPRHLPPKMLDVTLDIYTIRVANRTTGEVYLEGDLERGIVPEESVWTHGQGDGEDGCMLYLHKMNLELLRRHWMHSEMWWPRLFRTHAEIAWDDYEKDYSDLPAPVLERHKAAEAIKDVERTQEAEVKSKREALQERDDARVRKRQERLHELRTGERRSWVELHRRNPDREDFAPRPPQVDRFGHVM